MPPPVSPPAGTAPPPVASPEPVHQVKPASFDCQGNQSITDPPPRLASFWPQPNAVNPDSVPADVKTLLQTFPSILRTGDVKPTPKHGVEHHIHTSSHPPVWQSLAAFIWKNLKLLKRNSKGWNPLASFVVQNHHRPLQKIWILAALWRLPPSQFGDNPGQVPFAKHARPFQWLAWLQRFFKNRSCQGISPNPCCSVRHPKNGDYRTIWLV